MAQAQNVRPASSDVVLRADPGGPRPRLQRVAHDLQDGARAVEAHNAAIKGVAALIHKYVFAQDDRKRGRLKGLKLKNCFQLGAEEINIDGPKGFAGRRDDQARRTPSRDLDRDRREQIGLLQPGVPVCPRNGVKLSPLNSIAILGVTRLVITVFEIRGTQRPRQDAPDAEPPGITIRIRAPI